VFFPHDRSAILQVQNEWYANQVFSFFTRELKFDGEDITTSIFLPGAKHQKKKAEILAKESGIFAGKEEILFYFSCQFPEIFFTFYKNDGDFFEKGEVIVGIEGSASILLKIERIVLNFLMRMCGIANTTKNIKEKASPVAIASTRKTLWGAIDKKAVSVGGGLSHRVGLFDAILIKENHLALWGESIEKLFQKASKILKKRGNAPVSFFEIEVETKEMFFDALKASEQFPIPIPVVIMFDNFSARDIGECTKKVSKGQNIFFEASGGITEEAVLEYAQSGADVLSLGMLTHTAKPIDLSFQILLKS
jgi:nicotinate-nucleotide pyrophosphorylase (carboxylating)